jgi:hypothetical protein
MKLYKLKVDSNNQISIDPTPIDLGLNSNGIDAKELGYNENYTKIDKDTMEALLKLIING